MKKILTIFNGAHNPMHVIRFSMEAAKENGYSIQAVFLDEESSTFDGYPFPNDLSLTEEQVTTETVEEEKARLLANNVRFVEDECAIAGVPCIIERGVSFKGLIAHSETAGFIALDSRAEFEHFDLEDVLIDAHCPVYLVADTAQKIKHVIFAFDGSEMSMYAIQEFTALFPKMNGVKSYLVSVNTEMESEHEAFIKNLPAAQANNMTVHHLEGAEKEVFIDFLRQYPDDAVVIMGAFSRSALSRMFHKSLATIVLNETRLSLFIAHR
ncbi:MAG TPA: universal stress protein [Flavisolibacter sp.]|jgi:nucleotide-binding universal stress UspA family protein|nr:universal stress protein [Flavisolibacter sp.]